VALVGVEIFDSHLFAVLAFFEKGIEKSEIILRRDEKTSYRVFLPPEALGLRGLSRVFNLELNYASIQQTAD
jgi:hypothetical protein